LIGKLLQEVGVDSTLFVCSEISSVRMSWKQQKSRSVF